MPKIISQATKFEILKTFNIVFISVCTHMSENPNLQKNTIRENVNI